MAAQKVLKISAEGRDFGGDEWRNESMLSGFGFLRILWTPINLKFAHIYPFSSFGPFSWLLIRFKLFEVTFGNTQWRKVKLYVWGGGGGAMTSGFAPFHIH